MNVMNSLSFFKNQANNVIVFEFAPRLKMNQIIAILEQERDHFRLHDDLNTIVINMMYDLFNSVGGKALPCMFYNRKIRQQVSLHSLRSSYKYRPSIFLSLWNQLSEVAEQIHRSLRRQTLCDA